MSDVDKIIKENDYVISNSEYDNEKVIVLKESVDFLNWFLNDKNLYDKKIGFILDNSIIGVIIFCGNNLSKLFLKSLFLNSSKSLNILLSNS